MCMYCIRLAEMTKDNALTFEVVYMFTVTYIAEVISVPRHAAIWRYLDLERRPTDKEVFPSLVRHCGTRCSSLFVTHL